MVEHIARVRWAAHGREVAGFISELREKEIYHDVLLKCNGGELIPAHGVVLAMASPFFSRIFRDLNTLPAPPGQQVVVVEGVEAAHMEVLLQYMYHGYAIVRCDQLPAISRVAKTLRVKEFPTLEMAPSDAAKRHVKAEIQKRNGETPKHRQGPSNEGNLGREATFKRDSVDDFIMHHQKKIKFAKQNDSSSSLTNGDVVKKFNEVSETKNSQPLKCAMNREPSFQSLIQPEEIKTEVEEVEDDPIEVLSAVPAMISKKIFDRSKPNFNKSSEDPSVRGMISADLAERKSQSVPPKASATSQISPVSRPNSVPAKQTHPKPQKSPNSMSNQNQLEHSIISPPSTNEPLDLDLIVDEHRVARKVPPLRLNTKGMFLPEVSRDNEMAHKLGPPGLLSLNPDEELMKKKNLRDCLLRRNPLLAVPSPTRIPLGDQQAHTLTQQRFPANPHIPYAHVSNIYRNRDAMERHPLDSRRDLGYKGESSKSLDDGRLGELMHLPQVLPNSSENNLNGFHRKNSLQDDKWRKEPNQFHHNGYNLLNQEGTTVGKSGSPRKKMKIAPQPKSGDPLLKKITSTKRKRVRGPKSWEFLLRLLRDPSTNPSLIRWENEKEGVFRLVKPDAIALRWGKRTGKHYTEMLSYENFARGLRYHYNTQALSAVSERCFVYKFGPKAWGALDDDSDHFGKILPVEDVPEGGSSPKYEEKTSPPLVISQT